MTRTATSGLGLFRPGRVQLWAGHGQRRVLPEGRSGCWSGGFGVLVLTAKCSFLGDAGLNRRSTAVLVEDQRASGDASGGLALQERAGNSLMLLNTRIVTAGRAAGLLETIRWGHRWATNAGFRETELFGARRRVTADNYSRQPGGRVPR